jgi:hypothetical protein
MQYNPFSFTWVGSGLAQWYSAGLRAEWPGFRVLIGSGNFSLHRSVQTDSGPHPASYPMGTRVSFPGDKADEACTWPLTSTYTEIKNAWCYTSITPHTPSWRGSQLKHRDSFTFYRLHEYCVTHEERHARKKRLGFKSRVQTGSGAHPPSYPMGTRVSFPGG